jgi:alpha-2-macroglobulin
MHIGLIVKANDWAKPLVGVPLEAEVLDARGLVVKRERLRVAAGGFVELTHTTQSSSPTGNYTINLNIMKGTEVLRQIGSTSVKVQEFMPDRMKVTAQLLTADGTPAAAMTDGWVNPKDLKGRLNAQNLFGTPATDRRVETTMTLSPAYPAFRSHPDFAFYDPQRAKEGFSDTLPEAKTDANGDATIALNLSRYARATYRLSLLGKVFEPEGGRSVAAEASVLVSELPYLVGVKNDGDLGFVSRGSKRISTVITIDPQAKPVATDGLTLQLVERKVVSVLMRQANETYRYESRKKDALVNEAPLSVPATGHALTLDTSKAGNYSYVLRDAAGVELNRIDYSVAGQGNVTRSLERNAELQLTLNKKDYQPGEDIEISVRAPYVGAGLITIERDKVFAQAWFKTTTTASVQKIKLPKDFEGNGYVNVQFIRDPGSEEIFMSPLSYGVAPFATSLAQRTNPLKLATPELTKPGEALKIKLTSEKPTRAVVFAIDEGILQVARYKEADPLGFFFQKRALEVKSAQILDLILPEFKRLMASAAPGGDEAGANARNLNPFKRKGEAPAVYWSGIVEVPAGTKEFAYTVPDHFNGTLRVMAVAVSDGTVGVASTRALVRGDFVISPNLPLMVAPGDVFDVSVGVANNIVGAAADSQVQLTLKPASTFEVVGPPTQTLKIGAMRESVATYRLKVKDAKDATLGSATLQFTSSLGAKSSMRKMDISVRPATPMATTLALGSFTGSTEVATPRDLVPEFRKQELAVSVLPLALAPGLMTYLDNFEHLCTEQLVSRTLPALVLAHRPEFASADRTPQSAAKTLDGTLRTLRTRQNAQGGFGLWTASVQADEFASVYAVHMMLEARELDVPGAGVPPDLLQKGIDYLQQLAGSNPADLYAARNRAYAIYLLTRNGAVTTPLVAGLRETLDAKYAATWKTDATASFMAATYQLLKQEKPAAELLGPLTKQLENGGADHRYAAYSDPTIRDAQLLYLLSRHFPARLKALEPKTFARFVTPLANGRYNTLSASMSILAIDAMARTLGTDALGKLAAAQIDAQGKATALTLPSNLLPRAAFDAGTVKLKLANDSALTTWYAVTQTGFDRTPPITELKAGLEVLREYVGADGKPLTAVKIGDEITVKLSLRGVAAQGSSAVVGNVAMTDLLPGGFEPVQLRTAEGAASTVTGPSLEYADVREDRVVIYAGANDSVQTWTYRIRATNTGEFVVPPAWAQSMYERERQARSLPGKVVVTAK